MARGGRRSGTMGQSYPNRTDLQQNTTAPATAPTGLPYGEHKQLVDAQRQIPVASPPVPGAPAPGGPPRPAPPGPGTLPWIGPTNRPNEPVQAGLKSGPGPGPEALGGVAQGIGTSDSAANVVRQAAAQPNATPDVQALAQLVNSGLR